MNSNDDEQTALLRKVSVELTDLPALLRKISLEQTELLRNIWQSVLALDKGLNAKIDATNARIDTTNAKLDTFTTQTDENFARMQRILERQHRRVGVQEDRSEDLDERLTRVEAHLGLKKH